MRPSCWLVDDLSLHDTGAPMCAVDHEMPMRRLALLCVLACLGSAAARGQDVPPDQARFIAAIHSGRAAYLAGENEMAKGAARPARARAICAILPRQTSVRGWLGTVTKLSSNSDGMGVLAVQIGEHVQLKTWNNSFSDIGDKTLIDPASALYQKAVALRVGARIWLSGNFIPHQTDCFREGSLTQHGSMTDPEFIFQFFDVTPAN